MTRNVLVTIVLIAAVVGSWLLFDRRQSQPPPGPATDSGYYLRNATIEGIGEDGTRIYTLRADRIVQDPGLDSVVLEAVDLEYALADGEPWRLTADDGAIPSSGTRIELRGNVTMQEQLMRDGTTIRTPALDIDLRAHLASTSEAVNVERGNYHLSATGMEADLKAETVTLQSEVHGRFLP